VKNKKRTAIILYAIYTLGLVLVITFGTSVARLMITSIEEKFSHKDITDVTTDISPDTELLAGRTYYPIYTAHGSFNSSPGLSYTSLDPEHLTVGDGGRICADTDFEGDVFEGRVRVTSRYNDGFEKILTFKFVKKYPEQFTVSYSVKGLGDESDELTVGVPVYVFSEIKAGSVYNVSDHRIVYDTEYFTEGSDGSLIPTRATEGATLTFAIEYGNGERRESRSFTVSDGATPTEFDGVLLNGVPADEFVGVRGESIEIVLTRGGERIATDYTLSLDKTGDANRDGKGGMYFLTVGDKGMTLTLPCGYSMTVYPKIRNVISAPVLSDTEFEQSGVITLFESEYKTVSFRFDGNVTYSEVSYEFDPEMMRFASTPRSFTIKPNARGTTVIRMTVDDGYTRVTREYTVHIKADLRPLYLISRDVRNFVSKVLGHATFFMVLAFFAMNMFKYYDIKKKPLRLLLYSSTGLSVALLTELIQLFMPSRHSQLSDVLIDMLGFSIGTLIVILVRYARSRASKSIADDQKNEEGVITEENA
jgi:hypothetical protein